MAEVSLVKLPSDECHSTLSVDPVLSRYMASLGYSELRIDIGL